METQTIEGTHGKKYFNIHPNCLDIECELRFFPQP